ncbi:MAG: YkvA family protein [Haloferacaceae archaeon]
MPFESWRERAEEVEAEVYAFALAVRDERTPLAAKAVIALLVAYAVSPIDPIPDVVPGLGYLDELVVLPVVAAAARRLIPADVMAECRERVDDEVDVGRARWLGAGLVVLVWALLGLAALRALGWA